MFGKTRRIHFVGIGGIGMSGIAQVLLTLGFKVTGSDLVDSDITNRLRGFGAKVFIGHRASQIAGADVVVTSSAIAADNVEVVAAREAAIPVIPRAEMLAELMRMKEGIAVAGTHGKTTTTSLIASVLARAGMDPTTVVGGKVNGLGTNARLGAGQIMVAEADESDGSFLKLSPSICVVTTIDEEHLDYYRDIEHIKDTFVEFINKVPFYGLAVLCMDQPHVQSLLPRVVRRYVTYGLGGAADFTAKRIEFEQMETRFVACLRDKELGQMAVRMPGVHSVYNSLAAIAVGMELEVDVPVIRDALWGFGGVERRFQIKGEVREALVVDDYGHHPAEIRATLAAAKGAWPERRVVVVFQPHRYTRTKFLLREFFTAFNDADVVIVTPIYPAGERPIAGVHAGQIADGMKQYGHRYVHFIEEKEAVPQFLSTLVRPGDLVLTLGAGDVWKVGEAFLRLLHQGTQ